MYYVSIVNNNELIIHDNEEAAKKSIEGVEGAKIKEFQNLMEAQLFKSTYNVEFQNEQIEEKDLHLDEEDKILVYTDGSFCSNNDQQVCAYAFVICKNGKIIAEESNRIPMDEHYTMRNIYAEVCAVEKFLEFSESKPSIKEAVIVHDYNGIGKWISGEWAPKNARIKEFVNKIKNSAINLEFVHIKGHGDSKLNNYVDKLAKKAANS